MHGQIVVFKSPGSRSIGDAGKYQTEHGYRAPQHSAGVMGHGIENFIPVKHLDKIAENIRLIIQDEGAIKALPVNQTGQPDYA